MDTSTVNGNGAEQASPGPGQYAKGGGIGNNLGTVTIVRSTLSTNVAAGQASSGGAIHNEYGTVSIQNSTISGNIVYSDTTGPNGNGGAIYNAFGSVMVSNSTVTANLAFANVGPTAGSGGFFNFQGVARLKNSILAANSTADLDNETGGTFRSGGFNLVGTTNGLLTAGQQ